MSSEPGAGQTDYVTSTEGDIHNVGEFEEIIGRVSDCVIIFPESPGSYAELGYFAKNDELSKKILIVNNAALQGKDSFIRRGPTETIDAVSKFGREIQIEYGTNANFGLIKERLTTRIVGRKKKRFSVQKYADLSFRHKFFAIFEILRFFEAMTLDGIEYAFRGIFGNVKFSDLRQLLSILVAAKFVRRGGDDEQYFCVNRAEQPFMEFGEFDPVKFRLELIDFYTKEFPEIAAVVTEAAQ